MAPPSILKRHHCNLCFHHYVITSTHWPSCLFLIRALLTVLELPGESGMISPLKSLNLITPAVPLPYRELTRRFWGLEYRRLWGHYACLPCTLPFSSLSSNLQRWSALILEASFQKSESLPILFPATCRKLTETEAQVLGQGKRRKSICAASRHVSHAV